MKKLIILSTTVLLMFNCVAQRKARSYEDYMQKSHKRTTAAWIFLGSGAALTAGGTALLVSGINDDNDDYYGYNEDRNAGKIIGGFALMLGGVALMGTSIPFFIMSHRYKRKAMDLAFKAEKIQLPRIGKISNQYYPALTLRFNLGQ
ncbi:MAG: hypothetical protein WDO19_00260 [Bacteroidota bacterium]